MNKSQPKTDQKDQLGEKKKETVMAFTGVVEMVKNGHFRFFQSLAAVRFGIHTIAVALEKERKNINWRRLNYRARNKDVV